MNASSLTSRERYLVAFRHEEPDRVPIFLESTPPLLYNQRVHWYTQFERAEVMLDLGCDPMINIWLPDAVVDPEVTIKTWREKRSDGIYLGKEFHTPKGILREVVEETPDWCDSLHGLWVQRTLGTDMREDYGIHVYDDWAISRRIEPWVKGREDLAKLPYIQQKPVQWQLDEWRHDAERAMEFAQKHDLLTMVRRTITNDATMWFCDIPWFMMQLYDDVEFVQEFLKIFEEVALWQTELALQLKPDVLQHRGWYDGPNFWGGEHFERHVVPFLQKQAQMVHEAGALHCYLLTQGWGSYLDTFQQLKTDILWGADPMQLGVGLAELKQRIGAQQVILGGISSEAHLTRGSEEQTRAATREAIRALAPGGGYVFGSGSGVGGTNRWSNISAMIDEAQKVGQYPIMAT